ncbi:hypothetical protein HLH26_11605 [Gluconacetobacter sp. 1b LMG 1731]|uniref:Uncharacterized protein n=1 Tax=Gluconacetobacter dulcium TaxID=2729096 RepID=A0A7W4ILW5_9PROT|nr:hypothetical protein [Gluconacetobacter dulcium]MBB2165169.1 hypothetical protein [Gluconacetobacter dulcium]MBB2194422.1 hypothetical protein [Gluconacetobacter dulcium]
MDELFSCRNCIHNPAQSLNIGSGFGVCLKHDSVIKDSGITTCKYLRRKDLAMFLVEESIEEHEEEYSKYNGIVNIYSKEKISKIKYSEHYCWENDLFDSLNNHIARYHKSDKKWLFIQGMTPGVDGRRSIAQTSLTRRYMYRCGTWKSSVRIATDIISTLPQKPLFSEADTLDEQNTNDALWDVIFGKLAFIQEYGKLAHIDDVTWATDSVEHMETLNWEMVKESLKKIVQPLIDSILGHAKNSGIFEDL